MTRRARTPERPAPAVPEQANVIAWRGLTLTPIPALPGFWRSPLVQLGDHRTADWKVQRTGSSWYARLRVGSDRFPGRGPTPEEALDGAMAEAFAVSRFIQQMMIPAADAAVAAAQGEQLRAGRGSRTRSESRKGAR